MTPVDYVARAIVTIAAQEANSGEAFNLVNPRVKSQGDLASILTSLGHPLEVVQMETWKARVFANPGGYLKPLDVVVPGEEDRRRAHRASLRRGPADLQLQQRGRASSPVRAPMSSRGRRADRNLSWVFQEGRTRTAPGGVTGGDRASPVPSLTWLPSIFREVLR